MEKDLASLKISQPAHRALANAGILSLQQLSGWTEKQLLQLHGLGPSAIPVIKAALAEMGLKLAEK